ncbi:replication-relaxation family protein [Geodermatophilus sp. URMC 65]
MTTRPRSLHPVDIAVLSAVNRYRYLTAAQANRLIWPNNTRDKHRYAQRRLLCLSREEYLAALDGMPRPAEGSSPRVHALGWRGRKVLAAQGVAVPSYYRPSEVMQASRNFLYMRHTLAVIDVLISAERLMDEVWDVQLTQLVLERELRRLSLRVAVPGVSGYAPARQVTVVPDGVFSLWTAGTTQHFVLEVDQATERERVWRDKVAALVSWVASPSARTLLPDPYVTVMVVTPTPGRRKQLRLWTMQELRARGLFDRYVDLFAFTNESPVTLSPQEFFGGHYWYVLDLDTPDSLVDLP